MKGQGHRPWSFEENSILWSVVVRPLLSEEVIKEPLHMPLYVCVKSVYWWCFMSNK